VIKRTLVARTGRRFKLDRPLRENLWQMEQATASTLFPILSGENIRSVVISNLTLDGNRAKNANLDGNYAGCIFLQDCNRFHISQVNAIHYNGDGISWQICHDVRVEHCLSEGHAGLGLHPGSGSQRPIIRANRLRDNDIGIFFCWGVKDGLAEMNHIEDNRAYGISIGHRDTDNLIRDNEILRSGKAGVLFRPERGKAFAGHRNRLEKNRILDSGDDQGIGVDVQGETESITLKENTIRETRQPMQRIGVRLGPKTKDITLVENKIEGFSKTVDDQRSSP
jgi:nitrous oxidase accessory protein NosD